MNQNLFRQSYKVNIIYYRWIYPDTYIKQAFALFNLLETVGSLRNRVWEMFRSQRVFSTLNDKIKHYPLAQQSAILESATKQTKFPPNSWFNTQDSEVICWLTAEPTSRCQFEPSNNRLDWNLPISTLFRGKAEITLWMADCSVLAPAETLPPPEPLPQPNPLPAAAPVQQFREIPIVQSTLPNKTDESPQKTHSANVKAYYLKAI